MRKCLDGIDRYGRESPSAEISSPRLSDHRPGTLHALSPARNEFWTVRPNPNCVSCFNEFNQATGLWQEKGGGYVPCVDCKWTCYHCIHASNLRPGKVDCGVHGLGHDATQVCDNFREVSR